MEERRKCKRYGIPYPIESVEKSAKGSLDLMDVSKGGVAFTSAEEVRKDEKINICVYLKNKMFRLKAGVVHAKAKKDNKYKIGVKFYDPPEDFIRILEKEIDEIIQLHRENNLYKHKSLSFEKVSSEYLGIPSRED